MNNTRNISWLEYASLVAISVSMRSKDPSTKVGAVILNKQNKVIGTGYNGMPSGFPDTEQNWTAPLKYNLVIHAEMNAILNATDKIDSGCMIVSTLRPCNNCLKHIRASGIRKAYYIWHREGNEFNDCDIIASDMTLRQFKPDINKLLSEIEQEHIVKPLVKGCK